MEHTYTDRAETERRVEMSALMFEPITDEQEIQDTLSGRSAKGETALFLNGLTSAYAEYMKKNPDTPAFIVPLNEREGTKFFGKSTDSLYATLHGVLKKQNLNTEWRLVRVKKDDDTFLRIVKL